MSDEQFLLEGDGFYYIIHKSSIVYDSKLPELLKGSKVTFLWPERALHRKPYTGEILECSKEESVLNNMLDKLKNAKANQVASRIIKMKNNVDEPGLEIKSKRGRKRKMTEPEAEKEVEIEKQINAKNVEKLLRKEANLIASKELLKDLDEVHYNVAYECSQPFLLKKVNIALEIARNLTMSFEDIKKSLEHCTPTSTNSSIPTASASFMDHSQKLSTINLCAQDPIPSTSQFSFRSHTPFENTNVIERSPLSQHSSFSESEKLKSNDFGLVENYNSDEDETENNILISKSFGLVSGYSSQEDDNADKADARNSQSVLSSGSTKIVSNVNDNMLEYNKENAGNKAVELLPDSGIYIQKNSLKEAKITSSSQTLLARKLMSAIFKKEALEICSLTGKGRKSEDKKPGLNKKAVDVILQYCRLSAKKAKWKIQDDRLVKDSLRCKLNELQKKKSQILDS